MKIKKAATTIADRDYNASPDLIDRFGPYIERKKGDRILTVSHETRVEERDREAVAALGWSPDLDRLSFRVIKRHREKAPRSASWLFEVAPHGHELEPLRIVVSWDHHPNGSTVWASCVACPVERFADRFDQRTISLEVGPGPSLFIKGIVREFSFTVHNGPPQMRRWAAKAAELFAADL